MFEIKLSFVHSFIHSSLHAQMQADTGLEGTQRKTESEMVLIKNKVVFCRSSVFWGKHGGKKVQVLTASVNRTERRSSVAHP